MAELIVDLTNATGAQASMCRAQIKIQSNRREDHIYKLKSVEVAKKSQSQGSIEQMRKLNAMEIALIAGTVSVVGTAAAASVKGPSLSHNAVTKLYVHPDGMACAEVDDQMNCTYYPSPPSFPPPYQPPPPPPPSGGGGSPSPPTETLATINVSAYAAKCQIKSQSSYGNTEYGAVLYNDNGTIAIGPIGAGNEWSAPIPAPPNIPVSQIIAFIHNHDLKQCTDQGYSVGSAGCNMLNAPSTPSTSPNGVGDWGAYNGTGSNWPSTWGYQNSIGLYVIGPDGVLRYFSPSNQNGRAAGTVVTGSGC